MESPCLEELHFVDGRWPVRKVKGVVGVENDAVPVGAPLVPFNSEDFKLTCLTDKSDLSVEQKVDRGDGVALPSYLQRMRKIICVDVPWNKGELWEPIWGSQYLAAPITLKTVISLTGRTRNIGGAGDAAEHGRVAVNTGSIVKEEAKVTVKAGLILVADDTSLNISASLAELGWGVQVVSFHTAHAYWGHSAEGASLK